MTLATLGLYGLGTMGSALALNIAENGFDLHVANRSADRIPEFMDGAGGLAPRLTGHHDLTAMAKAMPAPRAIILMVPAGAPVDSTIADLLPHLAPGDTLIDAGNADFNETRRRTTELEARGFAFIGMGVSGGEDGARHGPSMMVGGTAASWEGIRPVIEAIAAEFDGAPCADHFGPDGAGHFIKTVHNGIEYAEMQLIAEFYGLMRDGAGMDPAAIGARFGLWNAGPLKSYLVEITAEVLAATDRTGIPAVDAIVDAAGQKGTGRWTLIEALKLGHSASAIEAAVAGRAWSADRTGRAAGEVLFAPERGTVDLPAETLAEALLAARIIDHSQGFSVLAAASNAYDWDLDMARIAEVWRAGCIIRSALLDDISAAFRQGAPEGHLAFAPAIAKVLKSTVPALRQTVSAATAASHPVPALSACLAWFDSMTQARGSAALIQAQRDFFGRHGFDRVDGEPGNHGPWWG